MEANVWYFDNKAGLDFNCQKPQTLTDGKCINTTCCSSISDSLGNLLFYTDEGNIWNKNHVLMSGVKNPFAYFDGRYNRSIIVPQPANNSYYNIFYLIYTTTGISMNRVVIDMTKNNGLGAILYIDSNIYINKRVSLNTGLSAVHHQNNQDFWLISFAQDSLFSFLLTPTSFSVNPVKSAQPFYISGFRKTNTRYHRSSLGNKMIAAYFSDGPCIGIYNFDNLNGIITQAKYFQVGSFPSRGYICFSPNSKYLYFAYGAAVGGYYASNIFQYDISLKTNALIKASEVNIGNYPKPNGEWGQMQIAPDNRIYFSSCCSDLCVINYPDKKGLSCNYNGIGISFKNNYLGYAIPNFITRKPYLTRFWASDVCIGFPAMFTLAIDQDSTMFYWNFGDPGSGKANFSNQNEPTHIYLSAGRYKVTLVTNKNGKYDTSAGYVCCGKGLFSRTIPFDSSLCGHDSLLIDSKYSGFNRVWSTADTSRTIIVKKPGLYYVTISDSVCSRTDTIQITKKFDGVNIFQNSDTFFCEGSTILLDTKMPGYRYNWSTGDTTISITIKDSGYYHVTVSDGLCHAIDSIHVNLIKLPDINLGKDTSLCSGNPLILDSKIIAGNIFWNTGEISRKIIVNKKGLYWVIVTDKGCSSSDSIKVNLYPLPEVELGKDTSFCPEDQSIILNSGNAESNFWQPNGELTESITVNSAGLYKVIVTDSNDCKKSDSILVSNDCPPVIFIPNSFSPNGDGINDYFLIVMKNIIQIDIKIFDRWGEKIFYNTDLLNSWDGKYKGSPCPVGVYFYELYVRDINRGERVLSGTVMLVR